MAADAQSGNPLRGPRLAAHEWLAGVDRAAWRRFFLALLALALAFFLALYATALRESGQYKLAAAVAAFSLMLAALVAVRVGPHLARRTALQRWMVKVEYEFTREGAVYLAMIAVITVAALNTGNNLLFIILSCLLAGIVASGVLSRIVLRALELELALPEHVFAEQPILARLRLANLKQIFPTFSVTVSGHAASRRPRKHAPPPVPAILTRAVYVPYIPHRSSVSQEMKLTFPRRGRYSQPGLRISTRFPFGFLRKTQSIACGRDLLVLPNVQPTEKFVEVLPLIGSAIDSYLKGRSHDLYAIRNYQESDSARHVDWKATAKAQQLKVREFTREDEPQLDLVFDPRVPDTRPQTLERFEKAVALCASLAWHFGEMGAAMRFITGGFETPMSPANEILYPVLEKLALIGPSVMDGLPLDRFLADSSRPGAFQIILTHQPRESIPASRRRSSYFIFMDSL